MNKWHPVATKIRSSVSCAFVLSLLVTFFSVSSFGADVLIYKGFGACRGCAEAPRELAKSLGLTTQYAQVTTLTPELLSTAKVWIQPGGNALKLVQVFSNANMQALRDFVANGGSYIGVCAGAFFADATVDDAETIPGLGFIPGGTYDFVNDNKPMVLSVNWEGQERGMYFQGGPAFRIKDENQANVRVLARYQDGAAAAIEFRYGRGKVILVGPHPEAPTKWFEADGLPVPQGHNNDTALELIRHALLY